MRPGRIGPEQPRRALAGIFEDGDFGVLVHASRPGLRPLELELVRGGDHQGRHQAGRGGVEVGEPVQGGKARMAHPRDPAVYRRLAELTDQIEHAFGRGDIAAVLDGDRLFHATLVGAAGSSRLERFYTQLQQEQRLALSLAERSSRELGRTADDHRELLESLRGEPAQARAQLTAHLRSGANELQRLLDLLAQRKGSEARDGG